MSEALRITGNLACDGALCGSDFFAPILAEEGGFPNLHQMTSASELKLLLRRLIMLQYQILCGEGTEGAY
eukprot:1063035-Pelagomonas_calceolata.AAC.1